MGVPAGTIEIGDWTEGGRIPARIDLSNGRRPVLVSDLTDDEISIRWDAIVGMMDDEIREAVHGDIAPCTDRAFLVEYARRHETQFGSLLTLG